MIAFVSLEMKLKITLQKLKFFIEQIALFKDLLFCSNHHF